LRHMLFIIVPNFVEIGCTAVLTGTRNRSDEVTVIMFYILVRHIDE